MQRKHFPDTDRCTGRTGAGHWTALLDHVAGRAGYGDVWKKYREAFLPVCCGNYDGIRHHCKSCDVSQAEKNTDGGILEISGIENNS